MHVIHSPLTNALFTSFSETLLTAYISMNNFTEFHLDSIFKYGEDNKLPKEVFILTWFILRLAWNKVAIKEKGSFSSYPHNAEKGQLKQKEAKLEQW